MSLSSIFQDIADAIRTKTGKSESIYPVDMASEIEGISSGGGYKLEKMPSGAVSSFNDGTDLPLNKLKVSIEPVQDLHGYDAPWAGGAGKNKSPVNSGEIKSGDFVIFSTPLPSGNYAISFRATRTGSTSRQAQFIVYDENDTAYNSYGFDITTSRVERTLNATNGISRIYFYSIGGSWGESQNFTLTLTDFQVEDGNTATAYEPYSNICPISGWDEVNVTRDGKNLLPYQLQWYNRPADLTSAKAFWVKAGTYSISFTGSSATSWRWYIKAYNADKTEVSTAGDEITSLPYSSTAQGYQSASNVTNKKLGFTVLKDCYLAFGIRVGDGTATSTFTNCQLEFGSSQTEYEAYNGNTYNVSWQTEAGTVYGGTLDVVSGVLTVTNANIVSYNGEIINEPWISSMDVYSAGATPTTGAQVVYPLTTPQTIQLTPIAVRSLIELNNIWADTGDIMNGEYFKGIESGGGKQNLKVIEGTTNKLKLSINAYESEV